MTNVSKWATDSRGKKSPWDDQEAREALAGLFDPYKKKVLDEGWDVRIEQTQDVLRKVDGTIDPGGRIVTKIVMSNYVLPEKDQG